jgi:hypothetical protein
MRPRFLELVDSYQRGNYSAIKGYQIGQSEIHAAGLLSEHGVGSLPRITTQSMASGAYCEMLVETMRAD